MKEAVTMFNPIAVLLLLPLIASALLFFMRSKRLNTIMLVIDAAVYLMLSLVLYFNPSGFTAYFKVDQLNILFLLILGCVYFGVALYKIHDFQGEAVSATWHTYGTVSFLLFVFSMTGVILSTHAVLLWVFIEATTLMSAPLIYFSRTRSSLEATWKYIVICSLGIAMAFIGILFLAIGMGGVPSLFFEDLYRDCGNIAPFWLKLAFPFILVGFGTKAGLAPVHSWLPDAHSEAPSDVSAMLSGTLLNMAFLGILRFYKLMELANYGAYARTLLLVMGFLSLFVSAVFVIRVNNYKRMLAYSSIENMGIIAIGMGIGGIGIFAALLHTIAHSLTKSAFFLTSGNILHSYKKKEIDAVEGILSRDRFTGWLWLACFISIIGLPPFPAFISEFITIKAMFEGGCILYALLFFLLLTVIMFGMGNSVLKMVFGKSSATVGAHKSSFWSYFPQTVFIVILIVMGIILPSFQHTVIHNAAAAF